jgi:hypothetical protein
MSNARLKKIAIENNQLVIQDGSVIITNTQDSINITSGSLITNGGITILCTSNATDIYSGGALTLSGGMSLQKDIIIGQSIKMVSANNPFVIAGLTDNRVYVSPTTIPLFTITPNGIDQRFNLDNNSLTLNFTQSSLNSSIGSLVINGGGISINNSTNASGYMSGGALTISGGLSIGKDVYINQKLNVNDTVALNNGLLLNNSSFYNTNSILNINNNDSIYINSSIGSIITRINGIDLININSLNINLNQNTLFSSTLPSINSTTASVILSGGLFINNTTNATDINSGGALTLAGGLSVKKDVYLSSVQLSNLNINNNTSIYTSTGSLIINPINDIIFNTNDSLTIKKDGSLDLKGYRLDRSDNTLTIINDNSTTSNLDLYNSSIDNFRNTSFNIHGVSDPLSIGWYNNKYNINCLNNDLNVQDSRLIISTTGNIFINNNNNSIDALTINGSVSINNTDASMSLKLAGGLTVNNDIYLGNTLTLNNNFEISNTTNGILDISSTVNPIINVYKKNNVATCDFALNIYDSSTEYLSIYNTTNNYHIDSISTSGLYKNIIISTNTSFINISTNGNIGINNNTPNSSLDVIGNINSNTITTTEINVSDTSNNSILTLGGITVSKDLNTVGLIVSGNTNLINVTMNNLYTLNTNINNNLTVQNDTLLNRNLQVSGVTTIINTTNAIDTNSGALVLSGGVAIQKDLVVGGITSLLDTLNLKRAIFNEKYIVSETNSNFVIVNQTNGNNSFIINSNGITLNEVLNTNKSVQFNNTDTNSFHVVGQVLFEDTLNINGKIIIKNTTPSIDSSSGSLVSYGGVGINGDLNVKGNFNLIGNISVVGTVSNINSTNVNISDNVVVLNSGASGIRDSGVLINRYQLDNDIGMGSVVSDSEFITFTLTSQTGLALNILQLPVNASLTDNFYNGYWIKIVSGFSNNQVRQITSYTGANRQATLSSNFTTQNPSAFDIVNLYYKPFVGLIFNEINKDFELGSLVTNPSAAPVSFTSFSALKLNNLNIISTMASINITSGSIVTFGGISINNTTNATDSTFGGGLTVAGGAGFQKDVYMNGNLIVDSINITPSVNDIIKPLFFNAANNSSGIVTGLSFNASNLIVDIYLHATLVTTVNSYAYYHIRLLNKSITWDSSVDGFGDSITPLGFTVDNTGNVIYTTGNFSNFVSLTFKYRAITC